MRLLTASRPSRIAALLGGALALSTGAARADVFDLALQKLVPPPPMGGFADPQQLSVQQNYRQLVSELGVALAPKILTTADTIGYAGFQFTFDASWTTLSTGDCSFKDPKCPWYGVEAKDGNGQPVSALPGMATTISVYARKGIWLPLPSFEIGAGATKLMQSDVFAVQVYGKFALHEGFHDWPIPSLAVRGSGLRVMGAGQIDLTMVQIDAEISKSFGIAGSATLTPYLGAAALLMIAKGQVLDTTPMCDAYKMGNQPSCPMGVMGGPNSLDLNNNAVFPDQDTIVRWRFFGGLRLQYAILVLTADVIVTGAGDLGANSMPIPSGDDRRCVHANVKISDCSPTQTTVSVSGGFLF